MINLATNTNRIVEHAAITRAHGPFCSIRYCSTLAARNSRPVRSAAEPPTTISTAWTTFASHHRNRFTRLFRKTTDPIPIQNT